MQTPPPFSPPGAPPKKSNSPLLIVIIVVLCVLIPCGGLIALGYYGFNLFGKTVGPMASCVLMFEGARASIVDYKNEHEGKLPNADYLGANGFYMGCHQYLTEDDLSYMVQAFDESIADLTA